MTGFIIRIALAVSSLGFNVWLFATGHWGWGITFLFITAIIILSFFRNENMILALNQMRVGNTDKAKKYIDWQPKTTFYEGLKKTIDRGG